ncbi:MAG: EAL domain-containing protein [Candidatus Limnocylindrales bacterium]
MVTSRFRIAVARPRTAGWHAARRERDPFERYLPAVAVLAAVTALVEAFSALAFGDPGLMAESVLTAAFAVGVLVARYQIRAGQLARARVWFALGISIDGAIGAILIPGLAPATAILPGLSLLLVLPHVQRTRVLPLIALTAAGAGAIFLLDGVSHPFAPLAGVAGVLFPAAIFVGVMALLLAGLAAFAMDARDALADVQQAAARELKASQERLAIVAALRSLEAQATPEATADVLATALSGLPRVDLGVIMEARQGGLTVLGVAGPEPHPVHPGDRFPTDRAAYLLERSAAGPWAERWADRPVPALEDARLTAIGIEGEAFAAIRADGEIVGLVCILTTDAEQAHHLVTDLPAVGEFASAASAILAPALAERRQLATARAKIEPVIADGTFIPVFQPIVDIRTDRAVGFEALTRFADGTPPDQMFAAALRAGIGPELEKATVAAALRHAVDLPDDAWLALNASAGFILGGGLAETLKGQTRPIVIEITEHEPINDYARLRAALVDLEPPVRVSVDDAGAGIANFGHIVELRPDFVKLDISLIRGIDGDVTRQALVVGLAQFTHSLGHDVIAEGVETAAELDTLRSLGIRLGQGYLLARPGPVAAFGDRQPEAVHARPGAED